MERPSPKITRTVSQITWRIINDPIIKTQLWKQLQIDFWQTFLAELIRNSREGLMGSGSVCCIQRLPIDSWGSQGSVQSTRSLLPYNDGWLGTDLLFSLPPPKGLNLLASYAEHEPQNFTYPFRGQNTDSDLQMSNCADFC